MRGCWRGEPGSFYAHTQGPFLPETTDREA
uniref:Uncharacterized protein n=1 Tax=Anguilla anguilla TaxID=7936 RepID=A0A0E9UFV4_ANGAN